jgi:hypothetical protein
MRGSWRIALILAAALALSGCAPRDSGTPAANPPAAPASASALAAPPSPASSPQPCTTHACIVTDAKGLVGSVARDESVVTAMSCYSSTVKHPAPGVWTVRCVATYSDGSRWGGIASILTSQDKVTWEPTELASGG